MKDGKHVILCIDDDSDLLESMKIILESEGYVFESAGSAEDGLRVQESVNPDAIVVDLMMEEIDAGTNFVKDLKAKGDDTPIFMLSSVGDDLSMNIDYRKLGLDGVFQKPINPERLLSTLKAKLAE